MKVTEPGPSGPKQLLVVDDEESIRQVFHFIFLPPSYQVTLADSGESALTLAKTNIFHLAFVDIRLPGMDGIETSRNLRKEQPDLDIILMSGAWSDDIAETLSKAHACHFLSKPFTVQEAREVAQRLLFSDDTRHTYAGGTP